MKSATLVIDTSSSTRAVNMLLQQIADLRPLYNEYGEYLIRKTQHHFLYQQDPWGLPWEKISEGWKKEKKRRKKSQKILIMDGYLSKLMRYQSSADQLLFGSDRPYAAIHQFGGEIKIPARTRELFFKRNTDGSVGNKFVKRKDSDFAQTVNVAARTIRIPARRFLGISKSDEDELIALAREHLFRTFSN